MRFVTKRENIRKRILQEGRYRRGDRWWLALTDPLGGINRITDRVLGRGANVEIRPFIARESALRVDGLRDQTGETFYGVRMSLQW